MRRFRPSIRLKSRTFKRVSRKEPELNKVFRDPALQQEFARNGFVVRRLISGEAAAELRDEVAALRPDDGYSPQLGPDGRITYHLSELDSNRIYKRAVSEIGPRHLWPQVEDLLEDYKLLNTSVFAKLPGKGDFEAHSDWDVTVDPRETSINIWCPLVDVTALNGALQLLAGSHGLVTNINGPLIPPYYSRYLEKLKSMTRTVELAAGEALLFDSSIIHCSPPNLSAEPRYAVRMLAIPTRCEPVLFRPDPASNMLEAFRMNVDDYVVHDGAEITGGRFKTPLVARVENTNRNIGEEDFMRLLKAGDRIRNGSISMTSILARQPAPQATSGSWFGKMAGRVSRMRRKLVPGRDVEKVQ